MSEKTARLLTRRRGYAITDAWTFINGIFIQRAHVAFADLPFGATPPKRSAQFYLTCLFLHLSPPSFFALLKRSFSD